MLVIDSCDVCSICGHSRLGNMMIDDDDGDDDDAAVADDVDDDAAADDVVDDDDDENQWMEWAGLFPSNPG